MKTDLAKVIEQIWPAIKALEKMIGVWGGISDDLTSIDKDIQSNSGYCTPLVQTIGQNSTVTKWNNLAIKVDTYRTAAYITTPPERVSLEEYAQQLQAQIDKAPSTWSYQLKYSQRATKQ